MTSTCGKPEERHEWPGRGRGRGLRLAGLLASGVLCGLCTQAGHAQCEYEVVVFEGPTCFGTLVASIFSMSDAGHVVGTHENCATGLRDAFVWSADAGFLTLPRLPGYESARAIDVNSSGVVVGQMTFRNPHRPYATVWRDGKPTLLGELDGSNMSEALAVNEAGIIVGYSHNTSSGPMRAVLWRDGEICELDLPIGPNSNAHDINDAGQIVGWMGEVDFINNRGFLWRDGRVTDLGVPPGALAVRDIRVNERGHVAIGASMPGEGFPMRAFFSSGSLMRMIEPRPPDPDAFEVPSAELGKCSVRAVNVADQVGGWCDGARGGGFLWQNGQTRLLEEIIPEDLGLVDSTYAMNDWGQIAVERDDDFALLTPILPLGDATLDCRVDIADLMELLFTWGPCPGCRADFNGDETVDTLDLLILLAAWGPCE